MHTAIKEILLRIFKYRKLMARNALHKMRIAALIINIAFLNLGCVTTKSLTLSECFKFKEGKFGFTKTKFHHWGNYTEVTERIDSLETIITSGHRTDTTTFKISWLDNCLYDRTFIKSTDRYTDSLFQLIQKAPRRYKIIAYTDRYYIEQSVGDRRKRDTIWVK
jgi:hypothetical protein